MSIQRLYGLPVVRLTTWDEVSTASSLLLTWTGGCALIAGELLFLAKRKLGIVPLSGYNLINAATKVHIGRMYGDGAGVYDDGDLSLQPSNVISSVPENDENFAYFEVALPISNGYGGFFGVTGVSTQVGTAITPTGVRKALPAFGAGGTADFHLTFREIHEDVDWSQGFELLRPEVLKAHAKAQEKAERKLRGSASTIMSTPFWDKFAENAAYVDYHYVLSATATGMPTIKSTDLGRSVNDDYYSDIPLGGLCMIPIINPSAGAESVVGAGGAPAVAPLRLWMDKLDLPLPELATPSWLFAQMKTSIVDASSRTDAAWNSARNSADGTAGGGVTSPQMQAQKLLDDYGTLARSQSRMPYRLSRCLLAQPGSLLLGCILMDVAVGSAPQGLVLRAVSGNMIKDLDSLQKY